MVVIGNNHNKRLAGFTVAELLIVIAVIAILATITFFSFTGIISRSNDSAADTAVNAFKKKADLYAKDGPTGAYPINASDLTSDPSKSYYLDEYTITYVTSPGSKTVDSTNGTTTLNIRKCSGSLSSQSLITATNITGLQIISWDYSNKAYNTVTIGAGNCPAA